MPLVNNYFDFSAGNSIKDIRIMETEMSKLLKTSKSVAAEINKISNIKVNINFNTKGIDKSISNVSSNVKSLGKDIENTAKKINGAISKMDNNTSSRGKGKISNTKDFSKVFEAVGSYATRFAETVLPSSASSAVSGAISGGSLGLSVGGPVGAVAGAIIGAGAEWALSEVKKETDKKKQRIRLASNIITTYLPKIAMSSLSYASDMEQSRINYENILGKDKGNAFVDKILETSNKSKIYEYSDLDKAGKQMLAAGFGQHQTLRIFDAVGNASVARGGGKEEAVQMMEAIKNMQTSGKVTFENMDVFKNIGVDAYEILADSIEITGKKTKATKEELKDLISKGVIPADSAVKYLISGLESKYIGMMYAQDQSFSGLISTIKDSANQIILGPLGKGFINGIKPALAGFASFFGLGTEGFRNLKDEISSFGYKIGELAGGAINTLRSTFNEFFNNEDFKNASLSKKFMMVFEALKEKADEWFEGDGKKLTDSIRNFFTDFFTELSTDSVFLDAVQGLWLAISPDSDTIKSIILKAAGLDFLDNSKSYHNEENKGKQRTDKIIKHERSRQRHVQAAIGLNRVPYDYYPALLHEGEAVLRRTEADNYRNGVGKGVIISKLADTIVVKDEADMYKIANILVSEIEKAGLVYGGAM